MQICIIMISYIPKQLQVLGTMFLLLIPFRPRDWTESHAQVSIELPKGRLPIDE